MPVGVAIGLWARLLAVPAAVALGALASRATTGSAGHGVAVLALGGVGHDRRCRPAPSRAGREVPGVL
ncbi:hypothetical protein [Micromonospora sp. C31]|uniref:hypothetical protein n=1 Tax=Micromonospora sp. C31 TaxID=2824876 RepID=UPI001FFD1031|nr:hypothetical protein [Micromonospora sp. C31]